MARDGLGAEQCRIEPAIRECAISLRTEHKVKRISSTIGQ